MFRGKKTKILNLRTREGIKNLLKEEGIILSVFDSFVFYELVQHFCSINYELIQEVELLNILSVFYGYVETDDIIKSYDTLLNNNLLLEVRKVSKKNSSIFSNTFGLAVCFIERFTSINYSKKTVKNHRLIHISDLRFELIKNPVKHRKRLFDVNKERFYRQDVNIKWY